MRGKRERERLREESKAHGKEKHMVKKSEAKHMVKKSKTKRLREEKQSKANVLRGNEGETKHMVLHPVAKDVSIVDICVGIISEYIHVYIYIYIHTYMLSYLFICLFIILYIYIYTYTYYRICLRRDMFTEHFP